jgi:hypothetical protein
MYGKGYRGPDSESRLNGTPEAFDDALKVSACNTPGVYLLLNREYGRNYKISIRITVSIS